MSTHPTASRGFTLIEMIVSVALFSVVMVMSLAAYLNLISVDHQVRATNNVVNNLSFAVDSMARSIREGTNYCVAGCTTSSFSYIDQNACTITYQLANNAVVESQTGSGCSTLSQVPLTDAAATGANVQVSTLTFKTSGTGTGSGMQPSVLFTIHGTLQVDATHSTTFTIETGATQRTINL